MQLQRESGTAEEQSLDKEARKWASRVAREYKSVVHIQKVRTAPIRALNTVSTQEIIQSILKVCKDVFWLE